jgi:hypothetical protein
MDKFQPSKNTIANNFNIEAIFSKKIQHELMSIFLLTTTSSLEYGISFKRFNLAFEN